MRYFMVTYFKQRNGQIDEQAGFAKKLRPIDLQTCNVILDYLDRRLVKCYIEGKLQDTTFDSMHEYYSKVYPDLIGQLVKLNTPVEVQREEE